MGTVVGRFAPPTRPPFRHGLRPLGAYGTSDGMGRAQQVAPARQTPQTLPATQVHDPFMQKERFRYRSSDRSSQ